MRLYRYALLGLLGMICVSVAQAQETRMTPLRESKSYVPKSVQAEIESSLALELSIMIDGQSSQQTFPELIESRCRSLGAAFCRIYCQHQTEHSYNNCMNGFHFIINVDGCLDKINAFCGGLTAEN